jgi:Protein of unknown function (DUF732)
VARQNYPGLKQVDDATIIKGGKAACAALDNGYPVNRIVMVGIKSGAPGGMVGTMVGFGIFVYCPEYIPDMRAWTNNEGKS